MKWHHTGLISLSSQFESGPPQPTLIIDMKNVISDNDGFKTIVELLPCSKPQGHVMLRFSTVWEKARSIVHEQTQYELLLNEHQLKNLKDLL